MFFQALESQPDSASVVIANGRNYEVQGPEKHTSKRLIEKVSFIKVAKNVILRRGTEPNHHFQRF